MTYVTNDRRLKQNRSRARKWKARGAFDTADIEARIDRQEARCHYCGQGLDFDGPNKWQVDHFVPLSQGGSNWASNIVIACRRCNKAKGTQLPWVWMPERFKEGAGRDG